jgi:hypothetical protein
MISRMVSRKIEGKITADDSELPDNRLCSPGQVSDYNLFFAFTASHSGKGVQLIQSRSLVIVLAVSFLIHAVLLVSSARNEVDRAQKPVGELLATQLAGSAAPLLINQDSVGLGLLAERFGQAPGILSLKISSLGDTMTASGGNAPTLSGNTFNASIQMDQKNLGHVTVVLAGPAAGDTLRACSVQLLISLALHLLLGSWLIWPERFRNIRVPILQPLQRRPRPEPVAEPPAPVETPPPPAATFYLQVALEDGKGLLQRVNASTADQMLVILDKLLLRATRLYQGKTLHAFGPEGATLRFEGDDAADCLQRALACGRLFLALADAAYQQRRNAKLFALPVKAAIGELGDREEGAVLDETMQLARRGTAQALLLAVSETLVEPLKALQKLESLDKPAPAAETENPDTTAPADNGAEPAATDAEPAGAEETTEAASVETPTADTPADVGAPWRVLGLSDEEESRIEAQKTQILERRKPA